MRTNFYLGFFGFLSLSFSALGQRSFVDGYVVKHNSDTVIGQLEYKKGAKNYESCLFKNNQEIKEFLPSDILGYGYSGGKAFSSKIKEEEFVETLVLGAINLYRSAGIFYIQKNGEIHVLKSEKTDVYDENRPAIKVSNRWKGQLVYLMNDCMTDISKTVKRLELNERQITPLVVDYNICKGTNYMIEHKSNRDWFKAQYGVIIGLTQSSLKTNSKQQAHNHLDDNYDSFDPSFGLVGALYFPRTNENLSLQGELQYSSSSYSSLIEFQASGREFHETYIDLKTISLPLSVKYSSRETFISLFVQGGLNADYHVSSDTRHLSESVLEGTVSTFPVSKAFDVNKVHIGYWAGFGLSKSVGRYEAQLTARIFKVPNLNETVGFKSEINRLTFNLIIIRK